MSGKKLTATWIEKALARVNMSENGKVGLFRDYAIKQFSKGISNRKKAISKLGSDLAEELEKEEEVLAELIEEKTIISETVSVDDIGTREDRENYFRTFDSNLSKAISKVLNKKEYIDDLKKSAKDQIEKLEKEIKIFEEKLDYLK